MSTGRRPFTLQDVDGLFDAAGADDDLDLVEQAKRLTRYLMQLQPLPTPLTLCVVFLNFFFCSSATVYTLPVLTIFSLFLDSWLLQFDVCAVCQ